MPAFESFLVVDTILFPTTEPAPSAPTGDAPARSATLSRGRRWLWVPDRMAVLVVGLTAGFAVGLSFRAAPVMAPPLVLPAVKPSGAAAPVQTSASDQIVAPQVARRVAAGGGTIRIGVFGDSFGIGVWDSLYRALPSEQGFRVLRFGKEATGFAHYNTLDLEKRARAQLAADPVDIAVISFGANDTVPFYADDALQPVMSPGWQRIVGERIDRFVAAARSTGATVYWLGLPAMRDPELDAYIQAIDALYAAHMRRLNVPFLDTRALSVDAQGRYAAHLADANGVMRLIRTPDGLHMLGIGYDRITAGLVTRIRQDARIVRAAANKASPDERTKG